MLTLRDNQSTRLRLATPTAKGNPGKVDPKTPTTWQTSDETVVKLVPSADGTCMAFPGKVGQATVFASCDADLGDGVELIRGELVIEVVSGPAKSVIIVAEEPKDDAAEVTEVVPTGGASTATATTPAG